MNFPFKLRRLPGARGQRVLSATAAIAAARITSIVVPLITIPWSLQYLGSERFGMWMVATSIIPILAFFDGGLGSSVLNAVARARARSEEDELRNIVGTSILITAGLAAFVALIGTIITVLVNWQAAIGLKTSVAAAEFPNVLAVVVLSIAAGFLVNIGQKIRTGLQQIPAVAFWEVLSGLAVMPAILISIYHGLATPWLVASTVGLPVLIKGLGLVIFALKSPDLWPGRRNLRMATGQQLAAGSGIFLATTAAHAVAVASDSLLIANIVGAEEVSAYVILLRIFSVPVIFSSFLFGAQWPVYSESAARNDYEWIRKSFRKTFIFATTAALVASAITYIFLPNIISLWIGDSLTINHTTSVAFAVYGVLLVAVRAFQNLMFSLDRRKTQIPLSLLMAAVNVPLTIILLNYIGAEGAIIATNISYVVCLLIPYSLVIWAPRFKNFWEEESV